MSTIKVSELLKLILEGDLNMADDIVFTLSAETDSPRGIDHQICLNKAELRQFPSNNEKRNLTFVFDLEVVI